MKKLTVLSWVGLLVLDIALIAACSGESKVATTPLATHLPTIAPTDQRPTATPTAPPATPAPRPPVGTLRGVSLSPRSFEAADLTGFFEKAKQAGQVVSWAGHWNELGGAGDGGPSGSRPSSVVATSYEKRHDVAFRVTLDGTGWPCYCYYGEHEVVSIKTVVGLVPEPDTNEARGQGRPRVRRSLDKGGATLCPMGSNEKYLTLHVI